VLIALCQQYIEPENDILKKVAQANARTGMSTFPRQAARAHTKLTQALETLFTRFEELPGLKTHEQFILIRRRLADIEVELVASGEFFNESVSIYNNSLAHLPRSLLAFILRFRPREIFDDHEAVDTGTND
jgi:hypothetical protein